MQAAQNDHAYQKMSFLAASPHALRHYPQLIAQAADRATDDRIPQIRTLSTSARLLLQKIVRSLPQERPQQSVRISTATFGVALGVSDRTVARLKNELEHAGFITRHQVQSRRLGMQVADIWLTDPALQLLGLAGTEQNQRTPKMAHAYKLSQSLSERQPTSGDSQEKQPQQPDSQAVPPDLHLLQNCGLTVPAIRKLMGMASKAGHLLGAIVQAAAKHIAKAARPYCYVKKLIASGKDWGAVSAQQEQERQAQEEQSQAAMQHQEDVQLLSQAGPLTNAKQSHVWAWIDGWLKKTDIEAFKAGKSALAGHWLPVADLVPAAQALRDGRLFPVA